jgi:hypothetical protein
MLTPAEKTALKDICSGQTKQNMTPPHPMIDPGFAIDLTATYLDIRNYLFGGTVTDYQQQTQHKGYYTVEINSSTSEVNIHRVWLFTGRPGRPVISFRFEKTIGQNSADLCFDAKNHSFTLNLLYAAGGQGLTQATPTGWQPWSDQGTRMWAALHRIPFQPIAKVPNLIVGIDHWKKRWGI